MRTLKLLVCSAALLALVLVPTARASDETAAVEGATPPAGSIEAPAAEADVAEAEAPATETTGDAEAIAGGEARAPDAEAAVAAATTAAVGEAAATEPAPEGVEAETAEPSGLLAEEPLEIVEGEAPAAPGSPPTLAEGGDDEMGEAVEPAPAPALGEVGYDSEGRPGRIHVVVPGDTLWDISDAYLGTPWVWPSVWTDNRDIENPHLIYPGDHIWISQWEMRVVSPSEAESMLGARPAAPEAVPVEQPSPAGVPMDVAVVPAEQRTRRVSLREWVGLISAEELEAAASIVQKVPDPVMLAQMDRVYIGLGEGEVQVGDQFDIIRDTEKVIDPDSGRFLGHYVVTLGWLEVTEVHSETSLAQIGLSTEDIVVGDRLLPRRPEDLEIPIQPSPADVEGKIVFFPRSRVVIGPLDFVYLNRGTLDGLEAGSPLEVIRSGELVQEPARGNRVEVPERVIAKLLVVDAQSDTSVALVAETETDLVVGDNFRGATE
jgi:nucleoid-associated protein YgaU